jgi:DNA (cytosine-5)-methyltransferase 1
MCLICRYWYDPKFCVFEGAAEHESGEPRDLLETCLCCDKKLPEVALANGNQISYHLHDFVYLVDRRSAYYKPFSIGQITMLHSDPNSSSNAAITKATVRLLLRHDDFLDQNPPITGLHNRLQQYVFKDCRRLVLTDVEKEVPLKDLEATCRVRFFPEAKQTEERNGAYQLRLCAGGQEISSYKDQPDSFWFTDYYSMPVQDSRRLDLRKSILRATRERLYRIRDEKGNLDDQRTPVTMPQDCVVCEKRWVQQEARRNHLCKTEPKLRALDIFAGCGGMSLGLKQSGMVDTEYSIEVDRDAAATFRYGVAIAKKPLEDANTGSSRLGASF